MEELGIDIEAGISHLAVQGVDEVIRVERVEMIKDTMTAEGIREDQDTRNTNTRDASACSGVTGDISGAGTAERAVANMGTKETVIEEKLKRAQTQQQTQDFKAHIECLKRDQVQAFMITSDQRGLSFVSTATPITDACPGQHAWALMSDALADPVNKHLHSVSEELASWDKASP